VGWYGDTLEPGLYKSSERQSRSLYHSRDIAALKEMNPKFSKFPDDVHAIVSEPLSEMSEMWERVPESSAVVVDAGTLTVQPFEPRE